MRQTPDAPEPAIPVETSGTTSLAADVQAQTLRLKNRLAVALRAAGALPQSLHVCPSRGSRSSRDGALATKPSLAHSAARRSSRPSSSSASRRVSPRKGPVRTAIISALSGELFLVKEGETIAARYRVGAVSADAVELNDLLTGAVRRLALRD